MPFKLYNTKSKAIEEFVPLRPKELRVYHCGPTVYGIPSIGNYRAFLFGDLLRRHFEILGFKVLQVMNITDVGHLQQDDVADAAGEDKLQAQARKENKDPWTISRFYTDVFLREREALHILPPMQTPKATDHIPEMLTMIQKLIKEGFAYERKGNVYFRIRKFPHYGALSGNTLDEVNAGARVEVNEEKEDPLDFALWKQDPLHIMQWDSPWGKGFPGWHIECSAMSMKYLGETLDLHTGGEDNIFPHHECEIAQSESYTHKPFVRYWMHTRFLLVNGEKMSKSKGNFFVLDDLIQRGSNYRAIRYALTAPHYRQPMNFTLDSLKAAEQALNRIDECQRLWSTPTRKQKSSELLDSLKKVEKNMTEAMNEDLNISQALGIFFSFINEVNRLQAHESDMAPLQKFWDKADHWFGFVTPWSTFTIPKEVQEWAQAREKARLSKDFKKADEYRDKILAAGYQLKDTPQGPVIKK